MKKILITGASGFIGSFLVDESLKKGWEVWAGIRKSSNKSFLTDPAINFIYLDYSEGLQQQIENHVKLYGRWDYIIHCAGITKSAADSEFLKINYDNTRNLVDALRDSGNIPDKFVFMSSLGAFGSGDEENYTPIKSEDTPNPNSAYGNSKIKAERYLKSQMKFPYIILRPTGVYGPRERDYYVMVKMIKRGFDVSVGFKRQMLNFIYIKDLVKVCFDAIESSLQNKEWFVADGDIYSSKEYTKIVKDVLHKKLVIRFVFPLFVVKVVSMFAGLYCSISGKSSLINPDKYNIMKQRNWTCDISSLKRDLGFKPAYNLKEGMKETIAWYMANGWL